MGRQINFYYNKELQEKFFEYVNSLQVNIFITVKGQGLQQKKKIPFIENETNQSYITTQNLDEIHFEILENGYIFMSVTLEPVIEYSSTINRIIPDKNVLACRIFYEKYYFEGETLIKKPDSLEKLYEKLVRWIRKHCPSVKHKVSNKIYTEYMSPDVKEKMKGIFNFV